MVRLHRKSLYLSISLDLRHFLNTPLELMFFRDWSKLFHVEGKLISGIFWTKDELVRGIKKSFSFLRLNLWSFIVWLKLKKGKLTVE